MAPKWSRNAFKIWLEGFQEAPRQLPYSRHPVEIPFEALEPDYQDPEGGEGDPQDRLGEHPQELKLKTTILFPGFRARQFCSELGREARDSDFWPNSGIKLIF